MGNLPLLPKCKYTKMLHLNLRCTFVTLAALLLFLNNNIWGQQVSASATSFSNTTFALFSDAGIGAPVQQQVWFSARHYAKPYVKQIPVSSVYICRSKSAYAYHTHVCGGLSRCRAQISQVSVSEAVRLGYVPCKICYR